jgi:molybdopterin converting factor small subunit
MNKQMNIMVFGQLEDITGASIISIDEVKDTEQLLNSLYIRFPQLKEKKMLIAVDQKIIQENTVINDQSAVALLPPFSGG